MTVQEVGDDRGDLYWSNHLQSVSNVGDLHVCEGRGQPPDGMAALEGAVAGADVENGLAEPTDRVREGVLPELGQVTLEERGGVPQRLLLAARNRPQDASRYRLRRLFLGRFLGMDRKDAGMSDLVSVGHSSTEVLARLP